MIGGGLDYALKTAGVVYVIVRDEHDIDGVGQIRASLEELREIRGQGTPVILIGACIDEHGATGELQEGRMGLAYGDEMGSHPGPLGPSETRGGEANQEKPEDGPSC